MKDREAGRNPRSRAGTGAPKRRRETAADVARLADVSRSAVSRAYTQGAYVAREKRARIYAAASELGYLPNAFAVSLSGRRSNLVANVTGELANHYDSVIVGKLVRELSGLGKWPVVVGGDADEISSSRILDVLAYPLEALVIRGGSVTNEIADRCRNLHVPLIVMGRTFEVEGADSLCCDNHRGAALAADLLVRTGRRRIAYVGGSLDRFPEVERHDGFLASLNRHGMEPCQMAWSNFSFEGGFETALRLFEDPTGLDAIFCSNDAMALGVLNALRESLELRVPEDVAVIGFDDIEMAAWPCFRLATVRNSIEETVKEAMRILAKRFAEPSDAGEAIRLVPELVLRQTH